MIRESTLAALSASFILGLAVAVPAHAEAVTDPSMPTNPAFDFPRTRAVLANRPPPIDPSIAAGVAAQNEAAKTVLRPGSLIERPGQTAYDEAQARDKRKAESTWKDNTAAVWNQDFPYAGWIETLKEKEAFAEEDPGYSPYGPDVHKRATAGIWEEFQNALYEATSQEHEQFIRRRLLQKQAELVRLGDFDTTENVLRIIFSLLEPVSMAVSDRKHSANQQGVR